MSKFERGFTIARYNEAQQVVAAASAAHPCDCDYILTLLPAPAARCAGVTIHIMPDESAVAVGSGWYQADKADKVSAADYAVTIVTAANQSATTYGVAAVVAAMGLGGEAIAYGRLSTAITYGDNGGMAAAGVDGQAVSLSPDGLLRGEAGSCLLWQLDDGSVRCLQVGRYEEGVAGEWYRLSKDNNPVRVCA